MASRGDFWAAVEKYVRTFRPIIDHHHGDGRAFITLPLPEKRFGMFYSCVQDQDRADFKGVTVVVCAQDSHPYLKIYPSGKDEPGWVVVEAAEDPLVVDSGFVVVVV